MTTGGLSAWSPCTRNQEAERRPEVGCKTSRCGPLLVEKLYIINLLKQRHQLENKSPPAGGEWSIFKSQQGLVPQQK